MDRVVPKLRCLRVAAFVTLGCVTLCCVTTCCAASGSPVSALPDTFAARVAALASMETLNAEILGSRSATLTLESWCATHAMAATPKLVAVRVTGADKPATEAQRQRLQVTPTEPLRYRRVRLMCGDRVLSEADNWYVASRLTADMNAALDGTDVPFGKVIAPLKPTRQTFAAEVLWAVLPSGWELARQRPEDHPDKPLDIPPVLFEHHAILYDEARRPFSEVDEHYTRDVLVFGTTF